MRAPDASLAIAQYQKLAERYDFSTRRAASVRTKTVAALNLKPGQTVLDIACGTGVCFPLIEDKIGPSGRLIGVEISPAMLSQAERRVETGNWKNVTLIENSLEKAQIPWAWDAALFHFTHDVLRSKEALVNIFSKAKPGAKVAIAGTKLFPWWLFPLNLYIWIGNWSYVTTFEGLSHPWSILQKDFVSDLKIKPVWLGASYVASGTYKNEKSERKNHD